ncbi:MAG: hypothetical protein HQK77_20915 [Desulfobacterales bacterium]|nr:hypothetical protein [Desulfobacterales bacterium]
MMNNEFNLLIESEPTDEQLSHLMKEVAEDVRFRSMQSKIKFQEQIQKQVKDASDLWEKSTKQKL